MSHWPTSGSGRGAPVESTGEFPVPPAPENAVVTLRTSMGDVRLRLFPDYTPKTVANFVGLATGTKRYTRPNAMGTRSGPFFDGSIFYRVIDGAWIQGGDPTATGTGGPGYRFGDEFHPGLRFDQPYLVAMANAGPNTNGSQFFITQSRQAHLDFRNTIFGIVVDGSSRLVVDRIAAAPVGYRNRPVEDIVLRHVEVLGHTVPRQR